MRADCLQTEYTHSDHQRDLIDVFEFVHHVGFSQIKIIKSNRAFDYK